MCKRNKEIDPRELVNPMFLSWNEELTEDELRKNLIKLVTGYKLQEIFEKSDRSFEIKRLTNKLYFQVTKPNLKIRWDDYCEKIHQEYLEDAINQYRKYRPIKVTTTFNIYPYYNCGSKKILFNLDMWVSDDQKRHIWLYTKDEIRKKEETNKARKKLVDKVYYYQKRRGNYVFYEGQIYLLISVYWHGKGQIMLSKNRDSKDCFSSNLSKIRPYYTAHENLKNKGNCYERIGNLIYYQNDNHIITYNLRDNTYISNLPLNEKITRILYNFQREVRKNIIDIDIVEPTKGR